MDIQNKVNKNLHIKLHLYILLLIASLFSLGVLAENFKLGDVAPRGAPDGQLNAADSLILQRMILGDIFPTNDELLIGDVAPLGDVDGALSAGDLVVQQRAILGLVNLGTVKILPPAPTLYLGVSPTIDNPYLITGKASPNVSVDIYVQGVLQQHTTSDATDGAFSVNVYLYDGLNEIYAVENDSVDISPPSNILQVQYNNVIDGNNLPTNITVDTVWTPGSTHQPYIISSTLTINANASLIIQPGTELQFNAGAGLVINGELVIKGTAQSRVRFTSSNAPKSSGDWAGITVSANGSVFIDSALIEYAENGIYFSSGSSGKVSNSTIRYNVDGIEIRGATSPIIGSNNVLTQNTNGIYLFGEGGSKPTANISNNQIYLNASYNMKADNFGGFGFVVDARGNYWGSTDINIIALKIRSPLAAPSSYPTIDYGGYLNVNGYVADTRETLAGLVTAETILTKDTDYNVLGNLEIPESVILTIPEGVTLYFSGNGKLNVNGSLDVQGTSASPVVLTNQGKNKWAGVNINNTSTGVSLNYVKIENALTAINVIGSDISVSNSLIKNNNTGIKITGANGNIRGSVIQKNSTGIRLINASPIIQNNKVMDNVTFGISLYKKSSPLVNSNNVISGNVYAFWLTGSVVTGEYPQPVVNNNQIYTTSQYVFTSSYIYTGEAPKIDFKNNWWGTTDLAVISGKISDISDTAGDLPLVDFSGYLSLAGGSPVPGSILLGGNISDSQPGGNGLVSDATYQIAGNITVPAGEVLTIPAGVRLQFSKNAKLDVNGTLLIQGTAASPVVLTNQGTDSWLGVIVNSIATGFNINYAQIENAATGVTITDIDGVISNSVIRRNQQGIRITGSDGLISNNIFQTSNTGIILTNASPIIQANQIINNVSTGLYLLQQSSPVVNDNIINDNGIGFNMSGNATIGDYPQPIVNNNHISNSMDVSTYQYLYGGAVPQINFQNNWWGSTDLSAIAAKINDYVDSQYQRPIIDYSNILSAANGSAVPGTYLLAGDRFDAQSGGNGLVANTTYLLLGNIIVPAGETLTIPAGVQFRLQNAKLDIYGALVVQGTNDSPVIFTSNKDVPGSHDWQGIWVRDGANVTIDYAIIEYANTGIYFLATSSGVVSHSIISDNGTGIIIYGPSDPVIDSNTLVGNFSGITLYGTSGVPDPTITNNDIYGNSFNLQVVSITGSTPLNISGNWWGSDDPLVVRATISGANNVTLVPLDSIALTANYSAIPTDLTVSNSFISPVSSTGTKDSTLLSATLSDTGNWLIEIKNSAGQVVKTYSGTGVSVSFIWNGTDNISMPLPDGKYSLSIIVDGIKTRQRSIVIDNTPPIAVITAPSANAIFSSLSVMDITGTTSDTNIEGYTIEVADSHTPNEVDYKMVTSAQLVTTSSLFSWLYNDSNGQQEYGDKTIRLSVTDKAGNRSMTTVPITLDYLAIRNVNLSSDVINTQNGDSVNINFTLGKPATVTLRIYNELENHFGPPDGILPNGLVLGSNLVREKTSTYAAAGNYSINWDGLDDSGNIVLQDAYRFELIATSGSESNIYSPIPVLNLYNGTPRVQQTVDYANYRFYKNEYITLTATVPSSTIVRLFLKATSSQNSVNNIAAINKVVDEGEHIFLIDGRNDEGKIVNGGTIFNTSVASVYQKGPNAIFVKSQPAPVLQGTEIYPDIEIKSNPYRIKYSYDQISSIAFTVSEDSFVTVDLMEKCFSSDLTCSADPATGSVLKIISNELLAGDDGSIATIHSFEWRGYDYDASNIDTNNILTDEEGYYTFLIRATSVSSGLESTYRGSLLLYR